MGSSSRWSSAQTSLTSASDSRIVLRRIRWQTYEAILEARGDDPAPRLYYDGGTLEIRSPSGKHERLKKLLARFIETFTLELGIDVRASASTTLKSQLLEKGLEPDESYYVQNEALVRGKDEIDLTVDPPPDIAIEVDITSSSVDKLRIYADLGVPEVWSHDGDELVVRQLEESGAYSTATQSAAFPSLPLAELTRFLKQRETLGDTQLLRAYQDWVRTTLGRR